MKNKKLLWVLLPFAIISGILGRMGGAHGFDTKYRDIGCSFVFVVSAVLFIGQAAEYWWVYLGVFGFMWAAFSTYFQKLFKGRDNLAFSGLMVGLAAAPLLRIDLGLWPFLLARALALAFIWWALNKFLPKNGITIWRWHFGRDVVDENLRYASSL